MGFRQGSYAKVWQVKPISDTITEFRISTSRKNKQTDTYEQDFSGFVRCVGTATARKAAALKEGDKIKIGDCDVTTKYDKEKGVTYTNYVIFSFEDVDGGGSNQKEAYSPSPTVDDGELDDSHMPF